jgi:hypothetical protein
MDRRAASDRDSLEWYSEGKMIAPSGVLKQPQINAAITYVVRELSPWVRYIRYNISHDWSGQWAIFFRVVLSDDASTGRLREITNQVVWRMSERLDLPSLGLLPHFHFRSESEQAALNEAESARAA